MNAVAKPRNERRYPIACTSAYCGKSGPACNAECPHYAELQRFLSWKEEHAAVCVDPTWSPSFFRATR